MRLLFTGFFLVLFSSSAISQVKAGGTYKEYFQEGSYLMLEENFPLAQDNFQAAYELDSTNANIHYMMGVCYLHSATQKGAAERHLSLAVQHISKSYKADDHTEKSAPPLAHFYHGQALHINYRFDDALKEYDNFARFVSAKDKEWKKMLDHYRAYSIYAKGLVASPLNIQITNLGDSINTVHPEYSPVLSGDERMLIYTTRRPNTTGGMKDHTGYYNEDIVVSYKDNNGNWSSPQPISNNINTGGMEASINLSSDGQTLIMYKDGGEGMSGNIYYSTFDGKDWSPLKEFGSDVNTKYHESHACLSGDGHALFFASDRPGGIGGSDIYRCLKLPNGKWSKAYNMGPIINTEFDEDGAFIHPDGHTFFFASKGHKSMGGFDIMFATLNDEDKFDFVTNMGYPINTTDDDVFYVTSPDGKRGYLSSAHEGGYGEKDIYIVSIPDAKEKPLALFKGQIIPADGEKLPEDLTIVVTDKNTGEIIGTYKPRIVNGVFTTILPPGREYNFSYQAPLGDEFYNEDVFVSNELSYQEIKREVNLEPVKLLGKIRAKQQAITLNAIVFDNAKTKKPVSSAKLSVTDEAGNSQEFTVNEKGKYDGIPLQAGKKYKLIAEIDGKKSLPAEVSTMNVKSGKVVNQLIYMAGKPEKVVSKDLLLDITVKDSRTKKAIANANVTITDSEGNKQELTANENGSIKGIELSPESKYTVAAISEGNVSESSVVSTKGVKGSKKFTKTLLISSQAVASSGNESGGTAGTNLPSSRYEYYFKYNKNVSEEDETWKAFIDNIVTLCNSDKKIVKISIRSSASHVPTRAFKNNLNLAKKRAKNLQKRIEDAVAAAGGDVKKLRITRDPRVNGPKYRGDAALGREKYEKHQYVKARVR